MGLDITAYEKLILARRTDTPTDDELYSEEAIWLYQNPDFVSSTDSMPSGIYRSEGRTYGFRAGSYGSYNYWRRQLAQMVGTTPETVWENPQPGTPFVELINNSDCQGFIGTVSAAKLARDFAKWQERAEAFATTIVDGTTRWLDKYNHWRRAFQLAAIGGAVQLH